ncbi:MAG: radical SAM protein [Oscillospiraceae bacterium]|nr:radical SAM protein [Oscillospiraceae bacterium]
MEYEGRICRSPMERAAFMLPISVGCSYNACKFCTLFKHLRYRELPMEAIEAELERVKKVGGNPSRVFLGDGNAFGVNTEKLLQILKRIRESFPAFQGANMDATVTNIRQKSDEELKSLKEAGVDQLYLGIETGLDDVLTFMKKDHSLQEAYEAILRLHKAGMDYAAHMMTGVAGKGRGIENAEAIAAFFNRTHPRKIVNFSFFVSTRAPLWQDVESGLFEPADELENLLEERRLIELLDLSDVSYDGLHDGIEVRIRGTLPQDREKMLSKLDQVIEAYRAKAPVYALTGKEQQACDPHRTQKTE